MSKHVRVRFAPSPTGHLHIGGLRTALFNYLFAKHFNGTYLVRIEDTDLERSKDEYTNAIVSSLSWAQLESDEDIVIQSERIEEHVHIIQQLLADKKAYKCYCTDEEIVSRHEMRRQGDFFNKYDGFCAERTDTVKDSSFVIRFKRPKDKDVIEWNDLVRGRIAIEMNQLDDFIIARSDGRPMYNFVVVVDDAFMKISHVIRGDDHISNTPKQILLYQACGFNVPEFAHIPLILGPSGDRLSKRDGATSVLGYIQAGYLPDALLNYLVRLGWSYKDQEIFTRQELITLFTLDNVGKKGAIFDQDKLDWINSQYLEKMESIDLYEYIIDQEFANSTYEKLFMRAIDLYKNRSKTVSELVLLVTNCLHGPQKKYEKKDIETFFTAATKTIFTDIITLITTLSAFEKPIIAQIIKTYVKEKKLSFTTVGQPLRIALIGSSDGPGVFDLMALLGKETVIDRINDCILFITKK